MYDVHVIFDNRPGELGEIAAALEKAIAAVAAAMADPSRVKMLCALMDGR
ncbi:transcriptional regulator, partial [Enterobacter hormaechei subsp. steigerwaltii]|nr:transcriptional regulator [Enterobacter hormaechei subsp. steigerwaltii]